MAGYVTRRVPIRGTAGLAADARLNLADELVAMPWVEQLAAQGQVFTAGIGIEETAITAQTALDEQTPTLVLAAPTGDTSTVVLPLWFRVYTQVIVEEGGGIPFHRLAYVQKDKSVKGNGTTVAAINALGGSAPNDAKATLEHTVTAITAITADENIMLTQRVSTLDNLQSTENVAADANLEHPGIDIYAFTWKRSDGPVPLWLRNGAGFYYYGNAAGTGQSILFSICWAEVDAAVYV